MARILVVEDEEALCRAYRRVLEREGHSVYLYWSAEDALDEVEYAEPFDVALVDVNLPGMTGYDFVRRARRLDGFERTVVVLTSGLVDLVPPDLDREVAHVLDKPVDLERLLQVVDENTRPTLPPDAAPSSGA